MRRKSPKSRWEANRSVLYGSQRISMAAAAVTSGAPQRPTFASASRTRTASSAHPDVTSARTRRPAAIDQAREACT